MRCRYLLGLLFWVAIVLLKLDNEQMSFSYASGDVRDLNFADGWWNVELQLDEATKSGNLSLDYVEVHTNILLAVRFDFFCLFDFRSLLCGNLARVMESLFHVISECCAKLN